MNDTVKLIDGEVQHFESSTQERTDACKQAGTHKVRWTDFMGREFMLCPNCWYTEKVD